ncbi:MAG TPA: DUF2442 domain-containing protein [Rubricoccaceae bacterium]|jgi:hypothetical protein|nr:DUF2442 domain-containing protein [Rubricoccaceae bacterium]
MARITAAEPLSHFRLRLTYTDGTEGVVDLSYLAGRGVFALWDEPGVFEAVRVTPSGSVAWGAEEEVDLCPDALYQKLTGHLPPDVREGIAADTHA